jgi:hypothetical protein
VVLAQQELTTIVQHSWQFRAIPALFTNQVLYFYMFVEATRDKVLVEAQIFLVKEEQELEAWMVLRVEDGEQEQL